MKSSVALIGFMGTGKTAVGKALAKKLGKEFVELDTLIEQKEGKPITEIFQQEGEIRFRELEIEATRQVTSRKNLVIACGGGLVLNWINIARLRPEAVVVYLTASPNVILKRTLSDGETRPLLKVPDKMDRIRELLLFRKPFYERAADITIDTSNLDIDSVVQKIIDELKKYENLNK